jgi:predicted oxidoreductase
MENRNIDDLIKKGEELAKEHESIRNELPQEIKDKMGGIAQSIYDDNKIVTDIMRKIKKSFDENYNENVIITPIMYNPENFMPILGVLVKTETGAYHKKYTISISE